jgi:hypothetical protein
LFASAADTLQAFAADPQYGLGGQLGFTAVLHTWDQKLLYHVHLHCVIAGGALAGDGGRWLPARRNYLFPVRALSRAFRDHFLAGLQQHFRQGQLLFPGRLAALAEPAAFAAFVGPLAAKDWVVFSQRPFAGPEKVLAYLSRYTHRVAISNHRLRSVEDGRVTFDYRDRRDGNRVKQLTVAAVEFLRRFLLHVLPLAFCRIRHYGFLSNRIKEDCLARCRELLGPAAAAEVARAPVVLLERLPGVDVSRCPHCGEGTMVLVERLFAVPESPAEAAAPCPADSS